MVVCGGETPKDCFDLLATDDLPWERVRVTLSDERWVPSSDEESNEKLVRDRLLVGHASRAHFMSLYTPSETPEVAAASIERRLLELPTPFACVLLGMGEDGHFASLFPDADLLTSGLDLAGERLCMPMSTQASARPRVSLTMPALLNSDEIVMLIFGESKLEVLQEARESVGDLPVSHLLAQTTTPVSVLWAN
jgi:6-phosphogluconolactonase